jgi:hypothetical protein
LTIEVDEIRARSSWLATRIRWRIRELGDAVDRSSMPLSGVTHGTDSETLEGLWDVRFFEYPRGRRRLAGSFRTVLHAALFPLLTQLSEFQAAAARRLGALSAFEMTTATKLRDMEERLIGIERSLRGSAPDGDRSPASPQGVVRDLQSDARVVVVVPPEMERGQTATAESSPLTKARLQDIRQLEGESVDIIVFGRALEGCDLAAVRSAIAEAREKLKGDGMITVSGADMTVPSGQKTESDEPALRKSLGSQAIRQLLLEAAFAVELSYAAAALTEPARYEIRAFKSS